MVMYLWLPAYDYVHLVSNLWLLSLSYLLWVNNANVFDIEFGSCWYFVVLSDVSVRRILPIFVLVHQSI